MGAHSGHYLRINTSLLFRHQTLLLPLPQLETLFFLQYGRICCLPNFCHQTSIYFWMNFYNQSYLSWRRVRTHRLISESAIDRSTLRRFCGRYVVSRRGLWSWNHSLNFITNTKPPRWHRRYSTGQMGWMAHRKRKEIKQQPGNMLGCCLLSFHFLWAIHPIRPVQTTFNRLAKKANCPSEALSSLEVGS